MAEAIKLISMPILIEPSKLYCKLGKTKCRYFSDTYSKTCEKKDMHIKNQNSNEAPEWCPLKMDALFPTKNKSENKEGE